MKSDIFLRKTVIVFLFICIIFLSFYSGEVCANQEIHLVINGNAVNSSVSPKVVNGTTLVPIRVIAENLGCKVNWDADTNTVFISSGDIGENNLILNNARLITPSSPLVINGTKYDNGGIIECGDSLSSYSASGTINLNGKYNTLTFKTAYINKGSNTSDLTVHLDEDGNYAGDLTSTDVLREVSFDVKGVKKFTITNYSSGTMLAIVDIKAS